MAIHKFSVLVLASVLIASAHAGYLAAPAYGHAGLSIASPAITSQSANILRSYGNLGQVSTFSKTIDTPYSSVSKSDVRVSNPGLALAAPAYARPAYGPAYAPALAPAYAPALAPAYARPAYAAAVPHAAAGLLGVAYSPATSVSHMTYSAPAIGLSYAW